MPRWQDVKESLLLTEVKAADAEAKGKVECPVCMATWQEVADNGDKIVRTSHCECNYFYCQPCILKAWHATGNAEATGRGDWCPCFTCKKRGIPEDQYFVRHYDYIGSVAAKEVEEDYFHAGEGAPRFKWEEVVIVAVTVPEDAPKSASKMAETIGSKIGYAVKVDMLHTILVEAGVNADAKAPRATIEHQAHAMVCEVLRKYRMGTVKDQREWSVELTNAVRYVGDRIQLRRQARSKNKANPTNKTSKGKNDEGGHASEEEDGNIVEKILGHKVQNGQIMLTVKWLGYALSVKGAKSEEPYSNLVDEDTSHCLELINEYFTKVEAKNPNDAAFRVAGFELSRLIEDDEGIQAQ